MNAAGKPTVDSLPAGDFGAVQKASAGWLAPTLVDEPGLYRLAPLEQESALSQALVVRVGAFEYWVDHREPLGDDAYLAHDPLRYVTPGFEVHRIAAVRHGLTPDYVMPTGKTNTYDTRPGSTFVVPGVFALGAVSRTNGVMTVRFRWLKKR
jgi:hypothetical protein